MAYGERRMRRELGGFGVTDFFGMGMAAAFGIVAAIVFDLTQHDEGSALFVINKWVAKITEMVGLGQIPLYGVVLILMGLGAASILYFQPVTMRGAFAQGFGALAALTTIAPSDLGQALPDPGEAASPLEASPLAVGVEPVSYQLATAASVTTVLAPGYDVRIRIEFADGLPDAPDQMIRNGALRGRLNIQETGQTYNLFRTGGGDLRFGDGTLYIATKLPGDSDDVNLRARIEAEGYEIVTASYAASLGANPVWTIRMEPSGTPLFLQRMRRSYTF